MSDESVRTLISVIFVMSMVVVFLAALFSLGKKVPNNNKYFWPLVSFASFLGIAALVSVLIK